MTYYVICHVIIMRCGIYYDNKYLFIKAKLKKLKLK